MAYLINGEITGKHRFPRPVVGWEEKADGAREGRENEDGGDEGREMKARKDGGKRDGDGGWDGLE